MCRYYGASSSPSKFAENYQEEVETESHLYERAGLRGAVASTEDAKPYQKQSYNYPHAVIAWETRPFRPRL